jgi:large subunit ribosomal protein L24e
MPTCSFCKSHYKEPRGLTLFTFEGKTLHFCSSKCQKNLKLKRDPRKVNWIRKSEVGRPLNANSEETKATEENSESE